MKKHPYKKKEIIIKIQIEDISEISSTLTMVSHQLINGTQMNEFRSGSAVVSYSMEFMQKSDFKEIEIDGVWFHVIKSRME
jgi:hypothetical protein